MLPFGETILTWRLARGLTQAELARRSGISRPNLSAVEQGRREITLKTLRALALALDTRPGTLVDGLPPETQRAPLRRADLERIAKAAVRGLQLKDERQQELVDLLKDVASSRLATVPGRRARRSAFTRQRADRAWLLLKTRITPATIASLLDRMNGHAERS